MQTCYVFLKKTNLAKLCSLDIIDITAFLISSLLHDIGHPGLTNSYHQNKQTKYAIRYNDKSILENYHAYKGLRLLNKPSSNIIEKFSSEEKKTFRKRFINCILATDMFFHATVLAKLADKKELIDNIDITQSEENTQISLHSPISFSSSASSDGMDKGLLELSEKRIKGFFNLDFGKLNEKYEKNISKFDLQQDILNYLVHSSDVSNPAKELGVYSTWTKLVMQEFFSQGDLEKAENLPLSYLCDRKTTDVAKAQVGFINFIVLPLFKTISFYFPSLISYEDNIKKNLEFFKSTSNFDITYEI